MLNEGTVMDCPHCGKAMVHTDPTCPSCGLSPLFRTAGVATITMDASMLRGLPYATATVTAAGVWLPLSGTRPC